MFNKKILIISGLILLFGVGTPVAYANHSWGGYHWARTTNPFTLELGNNVSSAWNNYLGTTASDWSVSTVLDTIVARGNTKPSTCKGTNGRVEVCNSRYGNNGWLGVAQIWISGLHITKGTVKVNDTYFSTGKYNTPAWRNLVMCQEVGHTLGLDHQNENFTNANLGTCMDYTNDPDGTIYGELDNEHPNTHDYDELALIYGHLDNITTITPLFSRIRGDGEGRGNLASADQNDQNVDLSEPSAWGKAVKHDARGHDSLYVRDLGKGEKVFTFVIWAE